MRLYEINEINRFFTLVVREELFHLLNLMKQHTFWKTYNRNVFHISEPIRFEYIQDKQRYDVFIDDFFLKLSREEQEAVNFEVTRTLKICDKLQSKIVLEKLRTILSI